MSKSVWISGMGLMLLWAAVAAANDTPAETQVQVRGGHVVVSAEPGREPQQTIQVQVQANEGPRLRNLLQRAQVVVEGKAGQPEVIELGEYWLGVECRPASGPLSAQLGLPENQGLVVENVVPDSPAAKAGIQRYDVLVTAGEKPLEGIADLIEVVEATKEKELTVELIRRGEKQNITATPAKRPEDARPRGARRSPSGDWLKVDEWLGRNRLDAFRGGPLRFHFMHPGTILPFDAKIDLPSRLPGNMSVSIRKHGDKPAQIVVEKNDQRWEVTEEEIDKLPDDVRPHVQRMLGQSPMGLRDRVRRFEFDFVPDWTAPLPPGDKPEEHPDHRPPAPNGRLQQRLEERMDEMNRRIERLHKSMQELFQRHRPHDTPDEEDSNEA